MPKFFNLLKLSASYTESQYEQWVKSLTIEELGKHFGKNVSDALFSFIHGAKKAETFLNFIQKYSTGENDIELIKAYFDNIRKEYFENQINKIKELANTFNKTLNLDNNKYFIDLTKDCLSTRVNETSPLPSSFDELSLDEQSILFAKKTRKEAAKIIGYFTDIKERDSFFKALVLKGKTSINFDSILNDKSKMLEIQSLLKNLPVYNYTDIMNTAFPGESNLRTRKITPKNITSLIFEIFGGKINLSLEKKSKIAAMLFDEDGPAWRYIENNLVTKDDFLNKKEKFERFFSEFKTGLLLLMGDQYKVPIEKFVNAIRLEAHEISDSNFPPDNIYEGTDSFSSKAEARVIQIIRDDFHLACKTSQMKIPLPSNVDPSIANQYFKIDFIIHCPKLTFNDNIPNISANTIFVGEYYGMVSKEKEIEQLEKKLQDLTSKQNLSEGDIKAIERIKQTIKYNDKTPIKQAVEARFASIFGCGSFGIFPERTHGKWEKQIADGLNQNNAIFNSNAGESDAIKKLQSWYSQNKDNASPELISSISRYIDTTNGSPRGGEEFKYNKYTVWIESIKLRLKALHFENVIMSNKEAKSIWDLVKIQNCFNQLTVECYEDLMKLKNALKPTEKLISQMKMLNSLEKFLIQNENSISNIELKQQLERFISTSINAFDATALIKSNSSPNLSKAGNSNKMNKNIVMNDLNLIQSLVRLAQISEEIEETHPRASRLIDDGINDIANDFGDNEPGENVDENLFPSDSFSPVKTPSVDMNLYQEDNSEAQQLAKQIADNIINSGKIENIGSLDSQDGLSELNNIIDSELDQMFNQNSPDFQN